MKDAADTRRRQLSMVHVLKGQLGLSDEEYRSLVERVGGVRSAGELEAGALGRLIDELKRLRPGAKAPPSFPGRPGNVETDPQMRKIEALLADQGLPWSYAESIAKRMHRLERVVWEWLTSKQKTAVIAALAKRQQKAGQS